MPRYDDALDFMDEIARDHKDGKLTLIALKGKLKEHKAHSATHDTQAVPHKPNRGVKRPQEEHEDLHEDAEDGEGDPPAGSRSKGQAISRPEKKRKTTYGQCSTADAKPEEDISENENEGMEDDREPEGVDASNRNDAAGDEEEYFLDGIYFIGPSKDAGVLGRAMPKDKKLLKGRTLAYRQAQIAKRQYRSAPIGGMRHIYRKITSNAVLKHWNEMQRGLSTVCVFDTKDEDCSALLREVGDLMRARSFIRSHDLTVMKTVDAAEGYFIEAIARAKQLYGEKLKQLKFLPRQWKDYTRTEPTRHWEMERESDEE